MFFKRKYEQNVLKNCFTAYIVTHLKDYGQTWAEAV